MERKKQNGLLLAALLLAWVLSSCVCHTSAALLDSCTFRAEGRREPSAPAIYQLRGQYYLAHKVRFVCREDKVCIGGMVAVHGSEVHLPFGYERTPREKMLYFRLSPDAVRAYLGREVSAVPADAPAVIEAADWDEAAALAVSARPARVESSWESVRMPSCYYDAAEHEFCLMMPPFYSGDVYVKAPLAVLLLGVDIPVSAVATLGTVTGIFPAVAYAWDWIGSL